MSRSEQCRLGDLWLSGSWVGPPPSKGDLFRAYSRGSVVADFMIVELHDRPAWFGVSGEKVSLLKVQKWPTQKMRS